MSPDPKIIKLPRKRIRATRSVKAALKRVMAIADENGWERIIIIAEGKHTSSVHNTRMDDSRLLGMIEIAKDTILHPTPYP